MSRSRTSRRAARAAPAALLALLCAAIVGEAPSVAAMLGGRHPAVVSTYRTPAAAVTPPSPRRPRVQAAAAALAPSAAARLAAPACAQYADALSGRLPEAVRARGDARAAAVVAQSAASALVGLPVDPPRASLPPRDRLRAALARLTVALAGPDGAGPEAMAIAPRIATYARALGVERCG